MRACHSQLLIVERCVNMFHRVRSEIQDGEQKSQGQASSQEYREREARGSVVSKKISREVPKSKLVEKEIEQEELELDEAEDQYEDEQDEAESESKRESAGSPAYGPSSFVNDVEIQARPSDIGTGSFQRPFQPGGRVPGVYPGAYAPPQAYEAPSTLTAADRTLTIGRGINMSGEIDACDHLVVEGTVEAALKGAKVLEIAESGTFYGTVEIEEATIAGRFEGDITVNGRLTIRSSGAITGSIAYRELEIEAGAVLDGKVTPLKAMTDNVRLEKYRAGTDASAMAKAKEIISKRERKEPANVEGGIFGKANAK